MGKEIWILMIVKRIDYWEFGGIFETEELAINACTLREDFIFPAILNKALPKETENIDWKEIGGYYPVVKKEEA